MREPCIGSDPTCPCQDGDPCHYKGENAWPVHKCFMAHVAWTDIVPPMCLCDGPVKLLALPWGDGRTIETIAMCAAHAALLERSLAERQPS